MDHSKAFDTFDHNMLIRKLKFFFGFSNTFVPNLYTRIFYTRTICFFEGQMVWFSTFGQRSASGIYPWITFFLPVCQWFTSISFEFAKSTFNCNLTWDDHINSLVGLTYIKLRALWSTQLYISLKTRILIAKTYLIPCLLYGCELFGNCDSSSKRKLNVLFNNIARYVCNLRS